MEYRRSRTLAMMATVVFLLLTVLGGAQTALAEPSDVDGHWAAGQITEWVAKGLAGGYPDGTFMPEKAITRAEFVALVNKALDNGDPEVVAAFTDVDPSHWFYSEVAAAVAAGYVGGYSDGTFRPHNPITRQEVASIVSRLLQLKDDAPQATFQDAGAIAPWATSAVNAVVAAGLMSGYTDGTFRPAGPITRAEAVVTLDRTVKVSMAKEDATATVEDEIENEIVETTERSGSSRRGSSSRDDDDDDDIKYVTTEDTDFDITVSYGTSEEDARAQLADTVGVFGSKGETGTAAILWSIEDYNGNMEGSYQATGELILPKGWVGEPIAVIAMITVAAPREYHTYGFKIEDLADNYPVAQGLSDPGEADFYGMNPVRLSIVVVEDKDHAYEGKVRVAPVNAENLQLWAKDTEGDWHDINLVGWGPPDGFYITDAVTDIYIMATNVFDDHLNIRLVDVTGDYGAEDGIITEKQVALKAVDPVPVTIAGYQGSETIIEIPKYVDGSEVDDDGCYQGFEITGDIGPGRIGLVTKIDNDAFAGKGLTSVIIPESVTHIGLRAFNNNQIESIILPKGITTIENGTLRSNSLTSIEIPEAVTKIGPYAFAYNSLSSIIIPDNVTSIGTCAFRDNRQLTTITIGAGVDIGESLLKWGNNSFREAYIEAGKAAGIYTADTPEGIWTRLEREDRD